MRIGYSLFGKLQSSNKEINGEIYYLTIDIPYLPDNLPLWNFHHKRKYLSDDSKQLKVLVNMCGFSHGKKQIHT